jgi:hypothetical protein
MKFKVLIIAYYWPPAGGPGVQRWVKFVKYLPNFGITPILFVPENANYPILDETIADEVSKNITVIKHPIKEPYKWASFFSKKKTKQLSSGIISVKNPSFLEKILMFIRGNFFIPDARVGWVKTAVPYLENYLKNNPVDLIITTGPPHSLHLIGKQLKDLLAVNWIADFRDPWTTIHYHKLLKLTKFAKKKHLLLEQEVLEKADAIITTSVSTQKEFSLKTNKPIYVVTNGYDDTLEHTNRVLDTTFSLAHIGTLLSERNPEVLWKVLSELSKEDPEFTKDLCIKLVGKTSPDIIAQIHTYNLEPYLKIIDYVPHQKAISLQNSSQILLLIESDRPETKAIIPGKLFEYLQAKRPILALLPKDSDVISILQETQAGETFTFKEEEKLKKYIKEKYKQFKNNTLYINPKNIEKYSRKARTEKLSEIIKSCINQNP